jgi:hypothetical protein
MFKSLLTLGVCLLGMSCGGSDVALRTLAHDDVIGMTAGNAHGTTFSGTYVVTGGSIEGCRCRAGDCSTFRAQTGAAVTVAQQDGAVDVNHCLGGINEDGTFWCGADSQAPGNIQFTVNSGTIALAAGKPVSLRSTIETTLVATIGGRSFDCDLRSSGTARFVAP